MTWLIFLAFFLLFVFTYITRPEPQSEFIDYEPSDAA